MLGELDQMLGRFFFTISRVRTPCLYLYKNILQVPILFSRKQVSVSMTGNYEALGADISTTLHPRKVHMAMRLRYETEPFQFDTAHEDQVCTLPDQNISLLGQGFCRG